jgi:hypothetical protein
MLVASWHGRLDKKSVFRGFPKYAHKYNNILLRMLKMEVNGCCKACPNEFGLAYLDIVCTDK